MGSTPLILDLLISYERYGSRSNPILHDHLHYPYLGDIDKPLNDTGVEKLREYRDDYEEERREIHNKTLQWSDWLTVLFTD